MIIQKRFDGSQDFNNNWNEYVNGFGHLREEFFIGLEKLHLITSSTRYQLLISIKHPWGSFSAQYDNFRIGNSTSFYNLVSIGRYNGNLNVFQWNVNQPFSTYDQNHYLNAQNCAEVFKGGWWYQPSCSDDNLNGSLYGANSTPSGTTLMKIRPYTDLY
ncbi:angiopoietin-related protein 2-like [Drosophila nasuta]|uniref:angiopoietin-related protein 2-like n=1 Tax=Drosophila nasuta TaxID=42062 RepID=UPI00295F1F98|nr:angiopoietin-related protein 2-like [Drosophila nasuta]XP_060665976.1 angiopoietin-related protein 2-like [Drosophila nasuta]